MRSFFPVTLLAVAAFFPTAAPAAGCQLPPQALEVVKLTNQTRSRNNLKPLRVNCELYSAARGHTLDMAKVGKISHQGSDGSNLATRVDRAGYAYSWVGENVASGQRSAGEVVRDWMNSPGHRRNILNPNFTEIGVAYFNNYWTQVFGRPR